MSVTLLLSHRVSGANLLSEYFGTVTAALNSSENIGAAIHRFSILYQLEKYRDVDGYFHFQLRWPASGFGVNEFVQVSVFFFFF